MQMMLDRVPPNWAQDSAFCMAIGNRQKALILIQAYHQMFILQIKEKIQILNGNIFFRMK